MFLAAGAGDEDTLHFRIDGESAGQVLAHLVNVGLNLLASSSLCISSLALVLAHYAVFGRKRLGVLNVVCIQTLSSREKKR